VTLSSDAEERSTPAAGLLPIGDAAEILRRSVWTLKRLYHKRHLPVVIIGGQWLIPETFISMVLTAPRPGQAAVIEDIAARWFATYAAASAEAVA